MGQLRGRWMPMAVPQQPSLLHRSAAEGQFELLSPLPLLPFSSLLPFNSLPSVHPAPLLFIPLYSQAILLFLHEES